MATLVLSTVGTALGGPVGGAIGALIGQSIDQQILSPSRGPRLGDLKVQSSSYGTQIPRVYGSMRVAGTVVWATDLAESSETAGAKGQPSTTTSYSVSLAVAISSRAVRSVGRIWADGKLLRGAGGDFKVSTTFRFYDGSEDQAIDPLIGSIEGLANTPAYRSLAVAVFESLELAEYGNRIPFLTFEVFADHGAPTVGAILDDASAGIVSCDDGQSVGGYAAYGQSIKDAVRPLIDCCSIDLFDDGTRLVSPPASLFRVERDDLGNSSNKQKAAAIQREQAPARSLAASLRLGFYDPVLDYQSAEARATSSDKLGTEERSELPAAIGASEAKSLVQKMIAQRWARRDKLTLRLAPRFLGLQPGTRVNIDLNPREWIVQQCTIDGFVVVAELLPAWSPSAPLAADPGRIVANEDVAAADVALALFDVPDVLEQGSARPTLLLAASSPSPGWKSCAVEIVAGQQPFRVQTARRKSVLGRASSILGAGDPYLINAEASFDVDLVDQDQWLTSCDDDALVAGANLAVLGGELIQFGAVEPLGAGRFRLSRLLRGRGGTEWAMETHGVGEGFVLVERDAVTSVELPLTAIGAEAVASVRNVSGRTTASAPATVGGESLRPVSPVALQADRATDGSLALSWTRRSRSGFFWADEVDAPLGETSEKYRVSISGPAGSIELETNEPALDVTSEQLATAGPGQIAIEVRQVGDAAASRPCSTTIEMGAS